MAKPGLESRSLCVLPAGGLGHVFPREVGYAMGQGEITGLFFGLEETIPVFMRLHVYWAWGKGPGWE